jgi:hypothetical protein
MLEKAGKNVPEETQEEKDFKTRVLEIKSENEETNVPFNLITFVESGGRKRALQI